MSIRINLNGWTSAQKLDLLWVHLTGEALTYVESLTAEQTATYDRLVHLSASARAAASLMSVSNSPEWCISVTMSQPPTSSPST